MRAYLAVPVLLLAGAAPALAQGGSIDLGIARTGISIGNSLRWTGVRINWRDHAVERVNGLNITIRTAGEVPAFTMNGVALGVLGPEAARIRGLAFGLGGVIARDALRGIGIAGLGVVSDGGLTGISIAGLGVIAGRAATGIQVAGLGLVADRMIGLNVAGLGAVSRGTMLGLSIGGLAVVAEQGMRGIHVAGLAAVSSGDLRGITLTGLAAVGRRGISGITVAGLAVVSDGDVTGTAIGGLAVVNGSGTMTGAALALGRVHSRALRGIALAGYRTTATDAHGITASIAWNDIVDVTGLSVAAYNHAAGTQRGIAIGLFNRAEVLEGVQIGLLNWAGNNRGIFRLLPLLNVHF